MNESEFLKLYEQYGYYVHRRCLALLRNQGDADDACQEVFLRAQKYHQGHVGGSVLAWLYVIASRCCFDLARKRQREEPAGESSLIELDQRTHSTDPDRRAVLGAALRCLDSKTCEIGVLHYVDGYTQEEVAARTGYSRRTVGKKLQGFEAHLRSYGFGKETINEQSSKCSP